MNERSQNNYLIKKERVIKSLFKIMAFMFDNNDLVILILSAYFITLIFPISLFGEDGEPIRLVILVVSLFGFVFKLNSVQQVVKIPSFMAKLSDEIARIIVVCVASILGLYFAVGFSFLSPIVLLVWAVIACLIKVLCCILKAKYYETFKEHSIYRKNVAIICAGAQGIQLAHRIMQENETVRIRGFFDDRVDRIDPKDLPLPYLGTVNDLIKINKEVDFDQIVIALPSLAKDRLEDIFDKVSMLPVSIVLSPDIEILNRPQNLLNSSGSLNLLQLDARLAIGWRAFLSRLEDIVGACIALIIFSPLFILLPILIKLETPGPVFYRQKRHGFNNSLFNCYKFRSMHVEACYASETEIVLTKHSDPRVTKIGDFMRRTSLDEIPQFINVLKGDMSLVGPRPHPPGVKAGGRVYEDVIDDFARRYKVKPGITGWAQINGARGNTFTEDDLKKRFIYDLYYIQNWSLWLDIVIIIRTIFLGFTNKNAF